MLVATETIQSLRHSLVNHGVYQAMNTPDRVVLFMEHHVWAVWDFMSLLKALQARLTCVSVPWIPPLDTESARLVNSIVVGEESDEDGEGGHCSHFDLYHRAALAALAAGFTIGREDLIPRVFPELLRKLASGHPGRFDRLVHYLQRHVEVDGDEHGPAAAKLLGSLCEGPGDMETAMAAAEACLRARLELWDGILAAF